jgi:metallopeptidase MepB
MRTPPQGPPLFNSTPESIVNDAKRLIEASRKVQDQVVQTVRPDPATFANVLLPLAQAENARQIESSILCFYKDVSFDPKLRDASREAQKLLNGFHSETGMREDLFQLVDAVWKKNEDLDTESRLLLERSHKDFTRDGLGLPAGPQRDRFKEIRQRISQLKMEFRKNQNEESGCNWFLPQELDGIADDVLSELETGSGEHEGKLRFPLDQAHVGDALRYAKNSETRKRVSIVSANKYPKNVLIFRETMLLCDEAARLLGYPSHAAFKLQNKMAKTPDKVNYFLADLRSRLTAGGQKELDELKQSKKADLESRGEVLDGRFFLWDEPFYRGMILEEQYKVDGKKISEWFPLEPTTKAMLGIFEHLFGLVFEEIVGDERNELSGSRNGNDLVWHGDVRIFAVWDDEEEDGGFVGYLYLDLYSRKGKYQGPANFNL